MKTFIYKSYTNYGTMVHIINAENREAADKISLSTNVWDDADVEELDFNTEGLVYFAEPSGG